MMNYQRINQTVDGYFKKIPFISVFWVILIISGCSYADEPMKTNYTLSFTSNQASCLVKVNDMLVMNSSSAPSWTVMAGQTISSLLKNGENVFSITMLNDAGTDDDKIVAVTDDMWCSVTVKQVNNPTAIAGIKLIASNGNIEVDNNFYPSPLAGFGDSPRVKNWEENNIEAKKVFTAIELPEWNWTKGRPITAADISAIKLYYDELQQAFIDRDLVKIRKMTNGTFEALAKEQGVTTDEMWDSMNFESFFERGYRAEKINWGNDGYKMNSYLDGRLFRYEIGYGRLSPLEIKTKDGGYFSFTPYLSIIDEQVVAVR